VKKQRGKGGRESHFGRGGERGLCLLVHKKGKVSICLLAEEEEFKVANRISEKEEGRRTNSAVPDAYMTIDKEGKAPFYEKKVFVLTKRGERGGGGKMGPNTINIRGKVSLSGSLAPYSKWNKWGGTFGRKGRCGLFESDYKGEKLVEKI